MPGCSVSFMRRILAQRRPIIRFAGFSEAVRDGDMAARQPHQRWNARTPRWGAFWLPLSGQVLVCRVAGHAVDLDLVADDGALPVGTPFVVVARIPSDSLHAMVEPLLAQWMEERGLITASITCHHGLGRVLVVCHRTRILLDLRGVTVPPFSAAA